MENNYKNLSAAELEALLKKTQGKILDLEDEKDLLIAKASGQHIGSESLQSNCKRIEKEIETLNADIEKIKAAIPG